LSINNNGNDTPYGSDPACPVCGGDLGKDDKFCFVCGAKVEPVTEHEANPPYDAVPLHDPAPLHEAAPPYEPVWDNQPYQRPAGGIRKKNHTPLFAGIAAVLAIALGAGIYIFFDPFGIKNNDDMTGDPEPDPYVQNTPDPTPDPASDTAPEAAKKPPQPDPSEKPPPDRKPENHNNGNDDDDADDPVNADPQEPSDDRLDKLFILDFSSSRAVTDADLTGLSLAELRYARNEIYARHGRLFNCQMLDKWFFSKEWYSSLPNKYAPAAFDRLSPSPLSRTESSNVSRIIERENYLVQNEKIFPLASTVMLTEYDVALRRDHLQRGLNEIYSNAGVSSGDKEALSDVERHNVDMIEYALSLDEIRY